MMRAVVAATLAAWLLASPERLSAQSTRKRGFEASRAGAARTTPAPKVGTASTPRRDPTKPEDDGTFRPTVVVRRGTSQGSGTIIATGGDESIILTASHVVRDAGPIVVELHRFNVGLEKAAGGAWPLVVEAEVAAADEGADVALLRIRKPSPLPFVARLYEDDADALPAESAVTSLGVDLGARLSSWDTKVVETARFQLKGESAERPFLITLKIPEHGRSGGGLFTADGRLVGVCVGHAELFEGRRMGVFSSLSNARRLIRENGLSALVDRSQARLRVEGVASH